MEDHVAESRGTPIAVTFIIPALNERDNLAPLIDRLLGM